LEPESSPAIEVPPTSDPVLAIAPPETIAIEDVEEISTAANSDDNSVQVEQTPIIQPATSPRPGVSFTITEVESVAIAPIQSSPSEPEILDYPTTHSASPSVSTAQVPVVETTEIAQANSGEAEQTLVALVPATRIQIGDDEIPARGVLSGDFEFPIHILAETDPSAPTEPPISARYASPFNPDYNLEQWAARVRSCLRERPRLYAFRPAQPPSRRIQNLYVVRANEGTVNVLEDGNQVSTIQGTAVPVLFDGEPGRIVLNSNGTPVCPL
jgi:hypothetical protein